MPESAVLFKTQGSQDQEVVVTTGLEIFSMLKFFKRKITLILTFIFACISGICPLIMVKLIGGVTTDLSLGESQEEGDFMKSIIKNIIRMAIADAVMLVTNLISQCLKSFCTPQFAHDLRSEIYGNLIVKPIEYFDNAQTGTLIARLSEDVTLIKEIYCDKAIEASKNCAFALAGVIIAFTTSWLVSLICVATLPLIITIFMLTEKCVGHMWHMYNDKSTYAMDKAEEVITQFRTVKSFDNELDEYEKYAESLDGVDSVYTKSASIQGFEYGILTFIENGLIIMLFYIMCYFIIKKPKYGLQPGDCITLIISVLIAAMGFAGMFSSSDDFRRANISSRKVLSIINPEVKDNEVPSKPEIKDVTGKVQHALNNFNMTVEPGQTVAIVGESGSGKSTVLHLLQRFYDGYEGEITIDGRNVKDFSDKSICSNIASVPQTPVIFSMSIEDNIKYSHPSASNDEVVSAANSGNAHDFINNISQSYNSEVSQNSLSGGQKQRICISRAIVANTPIIILDEATASLDTESESLVQKSIENFHGQKTVIVVAHRLSTVKSADIIYVMKEGRVVEKGNHEQLLSLNGVYSDLVKYQLQ
ncbi:ABC transporter family protein [Trichomonas vaginalis G3]|uniref:ABC transporter family protein n=1 Tax=Trichomonas vaginalis (strain ATCC PRA-98 / G3) TaxID=412133 RepID=A2EFV2_TRIV3|nr:ATPase activity, coupled to transmembrane movement of substances [Trichomonas vaginalis G3]EAY08503.1 ABC transporter family protein [Trichomonas vaginalis G3]KAI5537712.1 ATPase activity, coupled to transmembrane movement of substances [Trichomonas vaginalis G3]|eukprot:XP_001320726.1 ABC transporter family protein [Trichomonas vaginalis G3]